MSDYRFFYPIEIRYGDLDPQGHVNNARYLTYFEQARVAYIRDLGLWDGSSFLDFGLIVAEARLTFLAPARFGQPVQTAARVVRLGNKSLAMEYLLEHRETGQVFCDGSAVLVAYDYRQAQSISIPDGWRQVISEFEGLKEPG